MPVFGLGSEEKRTEALIRNLETPVSQTLLEQIGIGTASEQLKRYKDFEAAYRNAVADELRQGVANSSKRHLLEAALNPNAEINLSLISNSNVREALRDQFHTRFIDVNKLIRGARSSRSTRTVDKRTWKKISNVFNNNVGWI